MFCPLIDFMSFFVDLPNNRNYFPIQLQLIGFCNWKGECFLCAVKCSNDVYSKSCFLFSDPYKTLNAKRAPCRIFEC